MRVKVQLVGEDTVQRALTQIDPAMKKRLRPKLIGWAQRVLDQARALVPVGEDDPAPGLLKASGRIIRPTISSTASKLSVGVVFGGDPVLRNVRTGGRRGENVYALIQHEDLTLKHNDGQAKFLERPFMADAPKVPELVLEAADEAAAEV